MRFLFISALLASIPSLSRGATEITDSVWIKMSAELHEAVLKKEDLGKRFHELDEKFLGGRFLPRFESEGKNSKLKNLWGPSQNFDEIVKKEILPPALIDFLMERFGVEDRSVDPKYSKVVHAGVEHVFGYLFSDLETPFGYKRLRWTQGDIEKGFGLPEGTLRPLPPQGEFFSNITYLGGRIAFRNEPEVKSLLDKEEEVAPSLKAFDFSKLHATRMEETLSVGKRTLVLRTDFVPFIVKVPGLKNGELLVYSVKDSLKKLPFLVSLFPISTDFSREVLDAKNLGTNRPIRTRYNSFIPEITDSKKQFFGKREVISEPTHSP